MIIVLIVSHILRMAKILSLVNSGEVVCFGSFVVLAFSNMSGFILNGA